jgi:hypothetical protein
MITGIDSAARAHKNEGYKNVIALKDNRLWGLSTSGII